MKLVVPGAIAAGLLLAASSRADAALILALQEDGNPPVNEVINLVDFTPSTFTGTFGDFSVSVFAGSGANGSSLSDLLQSSLSVTNNDATNSHTLHLFVTQTDYTLPNSTNLKVESSLGGSVNTGTLALNGIFQAYADASNTAFGTGFTNGLQNATANGSSFDTGSAIGFFSRIGLNPYSLTSVANLNLGGGANANYSSHVNVTAVPEPMTLTLLGSGLLYAVRRRRATV